MNTQVVNFSNHELRVIEIQAQKWFCARDIAKALEFKNPDADVCNVYRRNKSEFDETMTCTCKLQVQGQTKTVRLYNREGAWLIGMFARTPKAAEFRKWVLKVLGAVADGANNAQTDKPVTVSEHTRSLPSGKKEIVLSEKAKTEIGGIVKSCVAFAVREELAAILSGCGKTEYWEVSDRDLLYQLYHWHATKNKKDTLEFRRLHAENDRLVAENADLKNRMSQISSWIK